MTDLPAGLADPLHILEPWPWRALVIGLAGGALAVWLVWRWVRGRLDRAGVESAPGPEVVTLSAFGEAVEGIRERARESSFFRLGCHELAGLLRGRLRSRHGESFAYLTAQEAAARLRGDGCAELLVDVSTARFARRIPDAAVLDALCDRALALDNSPRRS